MLLYDDKTFYIGITNKLKSRLSGHRQGTTTFTKKFTDIQLVYFEKYGNKYAAAARERQLKKWSHAKKQKLIDGSKGLNYGAEFDEVNEMDEEPVSLSRACRGESMSPNHPSLKLRNGFAPSIMRLCTIRTFFSAQNPSHVTSFTHQAKKLFITKSYSQFLLLLNGLNLDKTLQRIYKKE